jgi:hypothetical protein
MVFRDSKHADSFILTMNCSEVWCEMYCVCVAQGSIQCRDYLNTVINFWFRKRPKIDQLSYYRLLNESPSTFWG